MKKNGFTLVELAIVIVIIGLLVGGVLQGQELIKQAKFNRLASDAQAYKAAIILYKDKFKFFPGDDPNAFKILSSSGCTNTIATPANPTGCNGNGDGIMNNAIEILRLWQALAVARLIKGTYTGELSNATYNTGENIPGTSLERVGFIMGSAIVNNAYSPSNTINGNSLFIFRPTTTTAVFPFFTPEDAFLFDSKFDDGKPDAGLYLARHITTFPNCVSGTTFGSASYNTSYPDVACTLFTQVGI
jgi:prepilin-type N-terminal cleavage/methylation domain-containing protein